MIMQMNNISGDVKWNKIQEIEKELTKHVPTVLDLVLPPYEDDYDEEFYRKLAKRDIWILANKLYDIATEKCCLHHDGHNSTYSQHWTDVVELIEIIADKDEDTEDEDYLDWIRFENYKWCMEERDQIWNYYDYLNS